MLKLWFLVLIWCLICADFIIKMQIKSHYKEIRQFSEYIDSDAVLECSILRSQREIREKQH